MDSGKQIQLFCVARAIARKPRIVVMDEVTANLGQKATDDLLEVVQNEFKDTTVLSIAHRLNFIHQCSDRILFLNIGGTVLEFDTPANLLQRGGFYAKALAKENSNIT